MYFSPGQGAPPAHLVATLQLSLKPSERTSRPMSRPHQELNLVTALLLSLRAHRPPDEPPALAKVAVLQLLPLMKIKSNSAATFDSPSAPPAPGSLDFHHANFKRAPLSRIA
jgi:hypothetical protein